MDAAAVLERLTALGVKVTPRPNGNLYLAPASVIPPDLVEAVRQHKPEIMASLAECDDGVKRTLAARDRLCERLRKGQTWLSKTDAYLCTQEHVWDVARRRFADYLDLWPCMETQLRQLFGYEGCIYGPGQHCPADAVVVCQACAGAVR